MKLNRIKRFRRNIEEAGGPNARLKQLEAAIGEVDQDTKRLKETLPARRLLFRQRLESWWSRPAPDEIQRPFEIVEDTRAANKYLLYALTGVIGDGVLMALIFVSRLGISAWWGVFAALISGLFAEGIVLVTLRQAELPKASLRKIRQWLLIPSSILFLLSFFILFYAIRSSSPSAAVALHDIFNTSIWTVGLGLLGIIGTFLAFREILLWSKNATDEYNTLEREMAVTESYRTELYTDFAGLTSSMGINIEGVVSIDSSVPRR